MILPRASTHWIRGSTDLSTVCRSIYLSIVVGLVAFIVLDVWVDTKRLTSLAGMMLLLLLGFLTSNNPSKVTEHCNTIQGRLRHVNDGANAP